MRDVEADCLRAARRHGKRNVAGAGRQIERALARTHIRQRHQLRFPTRILSVRQHRGDEIVPIGDRGEERADVPAFRLG